MKKKVAVGSDHAGFVGKKDVIDWLKRKQFDVEDMGTNSSEISVDYPDFAFKVADAVSNGKAEFGILLCGSGVGVSIAANKIQGIRAALVFSEEIAKLSRTHNDANVMCLPVKFLSVNDILNCLEVWTKNDFERGRHVKRIEKICQIEKLDPSSNELCNHQ